MTETTARATADASFLDALTQLGGPGLEKMNEIGFAAFLAVELLSLASALFLFVLYQKFFGSRATGSRIHRSFPLVSLAVTTIFIAIQFSLPLSLGLLGALSIVRFRTPIKEPEEIGFILLVIASALCCATFNLMLLGILLAIAVVALFALEFGRVFGPKDPPGVIVVTLPTPDYDATSRPMGWTLATGIVAYDATSGPILELLTGALGSGRLDGITQGDDSSTISYRFPSLGEAALVSLSADVRRICATAHVNAFYERAD